MSSLSVIIITKNEEKNIGKCLDSVKFADEIIVLDSGSTDNTVPICRQFTPFVYCVDWPGFGIQKKRALEKCHSEWVLSLDADEVVSPLLANEIKCIIEQGSHAVAFEIPRVSSYCQKFLHYGDWRGDYCVRLFKRQLGAFKEIPIHEQLIINGKINRLQGKLYHYSFPDLETVLLKMNEYSSLSAQLKIMQHKKGGLLKAITHGMWTFIRGYFLKAGFLDGKHGFMLAVSNAEGCYYRYIKMMLLTKN